MNVDCGTVGHVPFGVLLVQKMQLRNIQYVEAARVQTNIFNEGGGYGCARFVFPRNNADCRC